MHVEEHEGCVSQHGDVLYSWAFACAFWLRKMTHAYALAWLQYGNLFVEFFCVTNDNALWQDSKVIASITHVKKIQKYAREAIACVCRTRARRLFWQALVMLNRQMLSRSTHKHAWSLCALAFNRHMERVQTNMGVVVWREYFLSLQVSRTSSWNPCHVYLMNLSSDISVWRE